jgi:ankyrin repeat protein
MAAVACPVEDDKKCLESVRDAIEEGANLNFQDEQGTSPLILAARRGHEKVARLLLDHGANVDLFDKENRTVSKKLSASDDAD